jgi:RsiW-degrading membrane proteinase PrsW (M82 family)
MLVFALLLIFVAIAAALAWFLIAHDRGAKEPVYALWAAAGLGLAGAAGAGLLESRLINSDNLLTGMPLGTIMTAALAVGIIEEICKFVPAAVFIYKRPFFNEHTDGIIYFALAGLAFGLPENILYTLQYGKSAGLARLLLTPIFHAAVTGTVGYYLAKAKLSGRSAWNVLPALAGAIVLHAIYDFGLVSGNKLYAVFSLAITLGISIALFMLYADATDRDQALGISAAGHNGFCRSCGRPNPRHYLYCVYCGKNA